MTSRTFRNHGAFRSPSRLPKRRQYFGNSPHVALVTVLATVLSASLLLAILTAIPTALSAPVVGPDQPQQESGIRVRGQTGDERIETYIDGQLALTADLSTEWTWYELPQLRGSGESIAQDNDGQPTTVIEVRFVNDSYEPPYDRNVEVDHIWAGGERFDTEATTTWSTGTWTDEDGCAAGFKSSEILMCNGSFFFEVNTAQRPPVTVTKPPETTVPDTWSLVWQDDFEGDVVDQTKWTIAEGDLFESLHGECYSSTPENVRLEQGALILEAHRRHAAVTDRSGSCAQKSWLSGHLQSATRDHDETKAQHGFTYGRFEARMRVNAAAGFWPAFWMVPVDEVYGGWPRSGEIDIVELYTHEPSKAHVNLVRPDEKDMAMRGISIPGQATVLDLDGTIADWHVYSVEWSHSSITWLIDDVVVDVFETNGAPFDQDFFMRLNLQVGVGKPGTWNQGPAATTDAGQLVVDWVRVWQR